MTVSDNAQSGLRTPYLTADIKAVPAAIKLHYEDFRVAEIPAYPTSGRGDHVYFTIEKQGLATMRAVHDIAQKLGVPARSIGIAGLKDARAVTQQTMSVEHMDPGRIESLSIPRIKVLDVTRHTNKLKIGHLKGNRFQIRLRDVDPQRHDDIHRAMRILEQRGVPNFFGPQRFGLRGDTWLLGKAVLANDAQTVIDLMLGKPGPEDTGQVLKARQLYEAGDYEGASRTWPYMFRDNRRLCRLLLKNKGNARRAWHAVDANMKKFFVNAFQSYLFNRTLARRLDDIDAMWTGDLAYKHDHGGVFKVEDAGVEQPRADAFEISPTGPIFGPKMTRPDGKQAEIEEAILLEEETKLGDFRGVKRMKIHGARRPVRFQPQDMETEPGQDEHGPFFELRFTLPAGCYATMILSEICKDELREGTSDEEADVD